MQTTITVYEKALNKWACDLTGAHRVDTLWEENIELILVKTGFKPDIIYQLTGNAGMAGAGFLNLVVSPKDGTTVERFNEIVIALEQGLGPRNTKGWIQEQRAQQFTLTVLIRGHSSCPKRHCRPVDLAFLPNTVGDSRKMDARAGKSTQPA